MVSFEQVGAQLSTVAAQQTDLQRAVAAGELTHRAARRTITEADTAGHQMFRVRSQ